MKLQDLLRHIADNEENGRDWYAGLDFKPSGGPSWEDVINTPKWFSLKPKTHTVNGFEVPVPVIGEPKDGARYFSVNFEGGDFCANYDWVGDLVDCNLFRRNLCFSTPGAAAANAKAMIGIDPND